MRDVFTAIFMLPGPTRTIPTRPMHIGISTPECCRRSAKFKWQKLARQSLLETFVLLSDQQLPTHLDLRLFNVSLDI